jgi:hypothetical protein
MGFLLNSFDERQMFNATEQVANTSNQALLSTSPGYQRPHRFIGCFSIVALTFSRGQEITSGKTSNALVPGAISSSIHKSLPVGASEAQNQ